MRHFFLAAIAALFPATSFAQPDPGHSQHGEAFDEGPRQFSRLIGNTGDIDFAVENCSPAAEQYINQGVGQLHGFINYEAERSFRHAAYLDDNCVMAFWGVAMANAVWVRNSERAVEIVAQARRRLTEANSNRERMYIEAIEALADPISGIITYAKLLRKIARDYPGDIDAKAFFVLSVWQNNLYQAMDMPGSDYRQQNEPLYRLAQEVLAVNPKHPVHHYIIHMWDSAEHYPLALPSADSVGFASPGIAHMWHMGGHIYNHAKMPFEMWWSQEAAARVDHAYMQTMRVFPFMLHNHAHNNEWLSRTALGLGNFGKALRLGTNLLAQPRHPLYNRIDQYQHLRNGVLRTLEVIEYGYYWSLGATLFKSSFLSCDQFSADPVVYQSCLRTGKLTELFTGEDLEIADRLSPEFAREIRLVANLLNEVDQEQSFLRLQQLTHLNEGWGLLTLLHYSLLADRPDLALSHSASLVAQSPKNVPFLLMASAVHAKAGELTNAKTYFARVIDLSQEVDLAAPFVIQSLDILRDAGLVVAADWRQPFASWRDVHESRPELNRLGPLLWQVPTLEPLRWVDKTGGSHEFESETGGRPAVLVMLLNDCPQCDAQYALLAAKRQELDDLGVALVAITSQEENMSAYQQMRAYDDFESSPIHGLYIINGEREIVWQDLSAEPFTDVDFLMSEVQRALHPLQRPLMRGD